MRDQGRSARQALYSSPGRLIVSLLMLGGLAAIGFAALTFGGPVLAVMSVLLGGLGILWVGSRWDLADYQEGDAPSKQHDASS